MELMPDERVIMDVDDGAVILTNFRVRSRFFDGKVTSVKSVTLDSITSCRLEHSYRPLYLAGAVIAFVIFLISIGSMFGQGPLDRKDLAGTALVSGMIGAVLLTVFAATRWSHIVISTPTVSIRFYVPYENREIWIEFIDALEEAKLDLIKTIWIGARLPPARG